MRQEAEYQIKNEIHNQIKSLIDENKEEIQKQLITKIIKELMEQICFSIPLKDILYTKITEGIENRYKDSYNLSWDLELSNKVKDIYDKYKDVFESELLKKIEKTMKDYKVDNYIISNEVANILSTGEKYQITLRDFLDTRIDDILDKI